jgi:hypothetical protein
MEKHKPNPKAFGVPVSVHSQGFLSSECAFIPVISAKSGVAALNEGLSKLGVKIRPA